MTASNQIVKGTFTNPTVGRNGTFEFWYKSSTEFVGSWKLEVGSWMVIQTGKVVDKKLTDQLK